MGFNGFFTPLQRHVRGEQLVRSRKAVRRLDVPTTEVELDHRDEALFWVFDCCHGKKSFGVLHEAVRTSAASLKQPKYKMYFVMRSNMLLGSRIKVGRVIRLRSAPGRSCEIIDISTDSQVSSSSGHSGPQATNCSSRCRPPRSPLLTPHVRRHHRTCCLGTSKHVRT